MKRGKMLPVFLPGIAAALLFLIIISAPSRAKEITYPVPAYTETELEKVRAWEKTWAGKKITSANVDDVKEFLPENFYTLLKDPEKWGESWFEIIPYKTYQPTISEIKFTREGKCTLDEKGNLQNYVSGIPFPNATTPLEMVYNFDNNNHGDSSYDLSSGPIVDGRRKYDRTLDVDQDALYFTGRREAAPVPNIPNNKKDIYWVYHTVFNFPIQLKGMRAMTIKWNDRGRDYGSWEFSNTTRRVVRRATNQRQRHISISDMTYNDQNIWNWVVTANDYKLLGKTELLVSRHCQDPELLNKYHKEGEPLPNGVQRERMNLYKIDVKSRDPNYIYSREVWYIDPESWLIVYADKYDKHGKLWKVMEAYFKEVPSQASGENLHVLAAQYALDVPRMHSSLMLFTKTVLGQTGMKHSPGYYTPQALLKFGY